MFHPFPSTACADASAKLTITPDVKTFVKNGYLSCEDWYLDHRDRNKDMKGYYWSKNFANMYNYNPSCKLGVMSVIEVIFF